MYRGPLYSERLLSLSIVGADTRGPASADRSDNTHMSNRVLHPPTFATRRLASGTKAVLLHNLVRPLSSLQIEKLL